MIKVFEAFAGYGSTCFALKELKIEHELVGFSEIDKYAIQCFQQNHGGKNYGDITKIDWKEVPDFDLLTGGFPCQAFSTAGKQLGEQDSRGVLGLELTRSLIEKQPKFFLFENVKGFVSKKFTATREKFIQSWENAGYKVYQKVLNTKDFGVPQNRERVWFVGIRKDLDKEFNYPQPFELQLKLKDILEEQVDSKYFLKQEQLNKLICNIKQKEFSASIRTACKQISFNQPSWELIELTQNQSKGYRIYSDEGIGTALAANAGGLGAKTGLYLLDAYNQSVPKEQNISTTIRTNYNNGNAQIMTTLTQATGNRAGSSKEYIAHVQTVAEASAQIRRLTPKECFRLQGFLNDQINLEGLSDTQKYKLAGNGQSINVVKLILKELLEPKQ